MGETNQSIDASGDSRLRLRVPARRYESARLLAGAALASIAFHGFVLLALSGLRVAERSARIDLAPMLVRLEPPAPTVALTAPTIAGAQPDASASASLPLRQPRNPRPTAPMRPDDPDSRQPEAVVQTEDATASPGAPSVSGTPSQLAIAETRPAGPSQAAEIDQRLIAAFRADIVSAAKRFRRYPPLARENNWEGTARVRIAFNMEGKRASIAVAQSSGHEILDRQAVETITNAFVPVPPALRGRTFVVEIPVIYDLKD